MKGAILTLVCGIGLVAGLGGLYAWSPWDAETRERELAWIETLVAWTPRSVSLSCEDELEAAVGEPPTGRLDPVYEVALEGCDFGGATVPELESSLIDSHRADATTTFEPELSRIAEGLAGTKATTHCWQAEDWEPLSEQYAAVGSEEFWLLGLASPPDRIDLAPSVCDNLRSFLVDGLVPSLVSLEAYDVSEALVVLAHEAEHLRQPAAREAEVECLALQRVRGLVRDEGHGLGLQKELALLAWDVGYPERLEEYRTKRCYDGGPLDLHPDSSAWP